MKFQVLNLEIHIMQTAGRSTGGRRTFVALPAPLTCATQPSHTTILCLRLCRAASICSEILTATCDRTQQHTTMPPRLHSYLLERFSVECEEQIAGHMVLCEKTLVAR